MSQTQFYIGVKCVSAFHESKDGQPGYTVVYPDGYTSWCPKAQFEKHNFCLGAHTDVTESNRDVFAEILQGVPLGANMPVEESSRQVVELLEFLISWGNRGVEYRYVHNNTNTLLGNIAAALPDDFSPSKDWRDSGPLGRVEWLKSMMHSQMSECAMLWGWLQRSTDCDTIIKHVELLRDVLAETPVVHVHDKVAASAAFGGTADVRQDLTAVTAELVLLREIYKREHTLRTNEREQNMTAFAVKATVSELEELRARYERLKEFRHG